jgi:hypothetical protein
MATTTATSARRRRAGGNVDETTEWARNFGLESTHEAQEAMGRTMRATLDVFTTFTEVSHRVNQEMAGFMVNGNREALKLMADMQGAWLDALQMTMGGISSEGPAVDAWQKLVDTNTRAFGRFAGLVQESAEKGTDRIKEAVDTMADQVKDAGGQLTSVETSKAG